MSNFENSLRPINFSGFVGQDALVSNLKVYVSAALKRNEVLDHCLFYGPPGLGKTSLVFILCHEMSRRCISLNGATLERAADVVSILSDLRAGDVLFIDEIHRLPKAIEEILYTAMEDFTLSIVTQNTSLNRINIAIEPFTLMGATTRFGDISAPLRDRFGIVSKLDYYSISQIEELIQRTSQVLMSTIDDNAIIELSKRSRGTPRIANMLMKRVCDFALIYNQGKIDHDTALYAMKQMSIDSEGLNELDREYLKVIRDRFAKGPVGIGAIASAINQEPETLLDVVEPYLLKIAFINRTPQGRILSALALNHLEITD